jgi:hypothetical protein
MEFPYTVESQDAFDELVKDRIKRVEAKFADYDDLKVKAEGAEAEIAAAQQATADAVARAETAEGKVKEFEGKTQVESWRAEVAKATGVPAEALAGSTKEEFEAHAAILKPLLTAQSAPVIPNQGAEPTGSAAGGEDERKFADFLTGHVSD